MNEITDSELIMLYHEKNEDAEAIIINKYSQIIKIIINNYEEDLDRLKIDKKYVYVECMELLGVALDKYIAIKNVTFNAFLTVLINRRIKQIIVKYSRKKNRLLDDSLSLDYEYASGKIDLMDNIEDKTIINPLDELLFKERNMELRDWIITYLSDFEQEVCLLLIKGYSYKQIGKILGKSYKQIDNTIQRIRNKIKERQRDTILLEIA